MVTEICHGSSAADMPTHSSRQDCSHALLMRNSGRSFSRPLQGCFRKMSATVQRSNITETPLIPIK